MILPAEIAKLYGLEEGSYDESKHKRDAGKFSKMKGKGKKAADPEEFKGHGFQPHPNKTVDGLLNSMVEMGIVNHGNRKQALKQLRYQYKVAASKNLPEAKLYAKAFKHVKRSSNASGGSVAAPTTSKASSPRNGAGSNPRRPASGSPSLLQRGARFADKAIAAGSKLGGELKQRMISGAKYGADLAQKGAKWAQDNIKTGQSSHQDELSNRAFAASSMVKGAKSHRDKLAAHADAHAAHKKAAQVALYYGDRNTARQHASLANRHVAQHKELRAMQAKRVGKRDALAGAIAGARGAVGKAFANREQRSKSMSAPKPGASVAGPGKSNAFIPDSWKKQKKNTFIPDSWKGKTKEELESFLHWLFEEETDEPEDKSKFSAFGASRRAHSLSKKATDANSHHAAHEAHAHAYNKLDQVYELARKTGNKARAAKTKGLMDIHLRKAAVHREQWMAHKKTQEYFSANELIYEGGYDEARHARDDDGRFAHGKGLNYSGRAQDFSSEAATKSSDPKRKARAHKDASDAHNAAYEHHRERMIATMSAGDHERSARHKKLMKKHEAKSERHAMLHKRYSKMKKTAESLSHDDLIVEAYDESKHERDEGGKFTSSASAKAKSEKAHELSKTAKTLDEHTAAQIAHKKAISALDTEGAKMWRAAGNKHSKESLDNQMKRDGHAKKMRYHYNERMKILKGPVKESYDGKRGA